MCVRASLAAAFTCAEASSALSVRCLLTNSRVEFLTLGSNKETWLSETAWVEVGEKCKGSMDPEEAALFVLCAFLSVTPPLKGN